MSETVTNYLARALIKDKSKGGTGIRDIKEIANACDFKKPKLIQASKELWDAEQQGNVEYLGHNYWRTSFSLERAKELHPFYI